MWFTIHVLLLPEEAPQRVATPDATKCDILGLRGWIVRGVRKLFSAINGACMVPVRYPDAITNRALASRYT